LRPAHIEDGREALGGGFDAATVHATHPDDACLANPCVPRTLALGRLITQAGTRPRQDGAGFEGEADGPGSQVSTQPRADSLVIGPFTTLRTTPSGPMRNCVGRA
jgi:hypothetical protein